MIIWADKIYTGYIGTISAFDGSSLIDAFKLIEKYRNSYYLVGYVRYEAKDLFLGKNITRNFPILFFNIYKSHKKLPNINNSHVEQFFFTKTGINYEKYNKDIHKIKNYIENGETYEVNYTYDNIVSTFGDGLSLYYQLLKEQKTSYNAYIKNDYEEILSFSPELFFKINNGKIYTKPMKGTVKRGKSFEEDRKNIEFLKNDEKNKAENVMIVDLLRNDLSKIAKTGTVKVPKLFEIETHKTLHQMTSEIEAELKENISLYDIFRAIFPCGSITGAPKIRTMEIIDEVESGSRDVYCGAIGLISKEETCFSVPIRILQRKINENNFRYRVGGAIVWDSTSEDEWDETLVKSSFLKANYKKLKIIETIKVQNNTFIFGKEHFLRMKKTAKELGFKYNNLIEKIVPEKEGMARILLSSDGNFEVQYLPLKDALTNKIVFSENTVNSKDIFLRYKTIYRPYYEKSFKKIKQGLIYDEIFVNEKGEITEGARSNIVVKYGNNYYTPPVSCGLLNGVMRQKMIDENKLKEKILYRNDIISADKIYCINSVRGLVEVNL